MHVFLVSICDTAGADPATNLTVAYSKTKDMSPLKFEARKCHFLRSEHWIIIIIIFIHQIPIQAHMKLHTIKDTRHLFIITTTYKIIKNAFTFLYIMMHVYVMH